MCYLLQPDQGTHVLHKSATDNTERRGTAVGSTAAISPADLPSQKLRKACVFNTNDDAGNVKDDICSSKEPAR